MPQYSLTRDAEQDLRDVARYTLNTWGKETLEQYRSGLKHTFNAIAENKVIKRSFSQAFPQLLVTKYKYHYIFYLTSANGHPIIIGVIHEKRDIVNQLSERLS